MRLSLYRPAASPVHRLDPRVKLGAILLFFVAMLFFSKPFFLLWVILGLVAISLAGRVAMTFLAGTAVLVAVGVLSFLFWPVFLLLRGKSGPEIWLLGAGMGLRVTAMLLAGMLLLLVTRVEEILAALMRLRFPFPAVFALGLTFRLVPALLAMATNVVEAQRLRGLRFDEGGLITRARRYIPLLIPILAGALRSAQRMSWALEAKGFGRSGDRTLFMDLKMGAGDWLALALVVALFAAAVALRVMGVGVLPPEVLALG
jgi:energy-coupling factor transporter transmembrane protein EcfT